MEHGQDPYATGSVPDCDVRLHWELTCVFVSYWNVGRKLEHIMR